MDKNAPTFFFFFKDMLSKDKLPNWICFKVNLIDTLNNGF